jgi:hypothetical protein
MTKKQVRLAKKAFGIGREYFEAMADSGVNENEFLWIKNEAGEVVIFASSVQSLKKHVPFMKN